MISDAKDPDIKVGVSKCSTCKRQKRNCFKVVLSQEEKAVIRKNLGTEPEREYLYCSSCWKAFQNPTAQNLVVNIAKKAYQHVGVRIPDGVPEAYIKKLKDLKKL